MSKWTERSSVCAGLQYGHVPGHQFHDVYVTISDDFDGERQTKWKVEIVETRGSAQGYDEVHDRRKVVAIDADLDAAVRIANSRAQTANIDQEFMIQALSQAHAEAVDA